MKIGTHYGDEPVLIQPKAFTITDLNCMPSVLGD